MLRPVLKHLVHHHGRGFASKELGSGRASLYSFRVSLQKRVLQRRFRSFKQGLAWKSMKKELQQSRSQLWHRERTPNLKSRSDRRKEDDQELRERKMKENPSAPLGMGALTHSFSPESFDLNLGLKSAFTRYQQADECQISSLLLECFFFKS